MTALFPALLIGGLVLASISVYRQTRPEPPEEDAVPEPELTPAQRQAQEFRRLGLPAALAIRLAIFRPRRLRLDADVRDTAEVLAGATREKDEREAELPCSWPLWKAMAVTIPFVAIWLVLVVVVSYQDVSLLAAAGVEQPRATVLGVGLAVAVATLAFLLFESLGDGLAMLPSHLLQAARILLGVLLLGVMGIVYLNASQRPMLEHGAQLEAARVACAEAEGSDSASLAEQAGTCALVSQLEEQIAVQQVWETGGLMTLMIGEAVTSASLGLAWPLVPALRARRREVAAQQAARGAVHRRDLELAAFRAAVVQEVRTTDITPEEVLAIAASPDSDLFHDMSTLPTDEGEGPDVIDLTDDQPPPEGGDGPAGPPPVGGQDPGQPMRAGAGSDPAVPLGAPPNDRASRAAFPGGEDDLYPF